MKTFRLTADCSFEAEDIEDALLRIGTHFIWRASSAEQPLIDNQVNLRGTVKVSVEGVLTEPNEEQT
jgi:hypothetical protein